MGQKGFAIWKSQDFKGFFCTSCTKTKKNSVKSKPTNQQIWKPKEPTLTAVDDSQPKLVLVEVTYTDAHGMPRTCISWVPDFNW